MRLHKSIFQLFFLLLLLVGAPTVFAKTDVYTIINNYRNYASFTTTPGPTIGFSKINLTTFGLQGLTNFALYNTAKSTFEPYTITQTGVSDFTYEVHDLDSNVLYSTISDNDSTTYESFYSDSLETKTVSLLFHYSRPITTSVFKIKFAENVGTINSATLYFIQEGQKKLLSTNRDLSRNSVSFVAVTASDFILELRYSEPIRVLSAEFVPQDIQQNYFIIFQSNPNTFYKLYYNPDKYLYVPVGESPNFSSVPLSDVKEVVNTKLYTNVNHVVADSDFDGVLDTVDNCSSVKNSDQKDLNGNSIGDACEDFDRDGVANSIDNCVNSPNFNQRDSDHDGIGDFCDPDESRLLEKYSWIPWIGIFLGFAVVAGLLFTTVKSAKNNTL